MNFEYLYVFAVLAAIEASVLALSWNKKTACFFKYLPSMFWIYFLPMAASTIGLIPNKSDLYDVITKYCLPASLILLLLPVDMKAIAKLGPAALGIMAASVIGVMVGAVSVLAIFKTQLPLEAWKGIGALSASWIGGSANMFAVSEAINTPRDLYSLMVIVDTIVPYTWMGILIAMASLEGRADRFLNARRKLLDELTARTVINSAENVNARPKGKMPVIQLAAICIIGTAAAVILAKVLPEVKDMISKTAWVIILATLLGVGLSFTNARKLERAGASRIGFVLLYFVLASIGARASLANIAAAPIMLCAGFIWVAIHAIVLLAAARLMRIPLALAATASQASIGGPASAPVVASVYHPQLAPVGLLLAILGNVSGTFLGWFVSQLCRMIS